MKIDNRPRVKKIIIIAGALILAAATIVWAQELTGTCYKAKNCQGTIINNKCTFEQCKSSGGRSWVSGGDCFDDIAGGYEK